jgi:hypothetical protein
MWQAAKRPFFIASMRAGSEISPCWTGRTRPPVVPRLSFARATELIPCRRDVRGSASNEAMDRAFQKA